MRQQFRLIVFFAIMMISSVGCRYHSASCKLRGTAYSERADKLKQDAHEKLTIGTKKDAVARFFESNGIPVTFVPGEATGTIHLAGCAPSVCGSDDAILGLRVKVDSAGTVISEPVVGGMYTNCL